MRRPARRPSPLLAVALVAVVTSCSFATPLGEGPAPAPPSPHPTSRASPPASAVPSAAATPAAPPASAAATDAAATGSLPDVVGAIGDSLTAAADVDRLVGSWPEHSWIVGTNPTDGVDSHLERLRALGADPLVADASRSGARIAAGPGQARAVAAAAGAATEAHTYVTFELGANDLCRRDGRPTPVAQFAAAVDEAFAVLRDGLAPGSLVVVLSVPDVPRLRELFAATPRALELYSAFGICPAALAETADVAAARERIRAYNAILAGRCEELDGPAIACRHDQAGDPDASLFGAPFGPADISTLDFFHPSLVGQARIADETWPLTPWDTAGAR